MADISTAPIAAPSDFGTVRLFGEKAGSPTTLVRVQASELLDLVASGALGLNRYATVAARDADTAQPNGAIGYVFANGGSPTDAANTFYQWNAAGPGWVAAPWIGTSLLPAVRPVADEALAARDAAVGAADRAEAAANNFSAPPPTSAEVNAVKTEGVNLSVKYTGVANGTAGSAVGTPPLVAAGKAFTVAGGFAVSVADTSPAAPAVLRHSPQYDRAVQTTAIEILSSTSVPDAARIGPLAGYTDPFNFTFWGVDKRDGALLFTGVSPAGIPTLQKFVTGAGALLAWTLITESLGGNQYSCTLVIPSGKKFGPFIRTSTLSHPPAYGVAAAAPNARLKSVDVLTDRSLVVGRLAAVEATLAAPFTAPFSAPFAYDRKADVMVKSAKDGKRYDLRADRSETILFDAFDNVSGTPVGSGAAGDHVPSYAATDLPSGYKVWGTMPFQILDKALAPKGPLSQSQQHGTGVSAITWPLSRTWTEGVKGVELSFELTRTFGVGVAGCFFRVPGGAILLSIENNQFRFLYRGDNYVANSADGATLTAYPHNIPEAQQTNLPVTVRAYENGGILAQIGDQKLAWGFVAKPKGMAGLPISDAGIYVDPRFGNTVNTRTRYLKIGPVPAVGGSLWRTIQPEPVAISPKFAKQGVVFSVAAANTGRGVLNFSVVPMHKHGPLLGVVPIDNYYAYYSTDHDLGDGGIFLATAPTPTGPWTRQGVAGQPGNILIDGANRQAETPVVHYDPVKNRLLMIYHVYVTPGANLQQSRVAESVDGRNWTIIDYIYDFVGTNLANQHARHTGYMSWGRDPLGVVPGWVGWSRLFPDVDTSICCTTRSLDGVRWTLDLLPTYFNFLKGVTGDTRVIHNHGYATQPFAYQGQRLMIVAPFRATGVGNNKGYLALVRLGDDMRNMSAQEVIPFPMTEPDELSFESVVSGVLIEGSILYLYYQSRGQDIRLATADLSKGPDGLARPFGA